MTNTDGNFIFTMNLYLASLLFVSIIVALCFFIKRQKEKKYLIKVQSYDLKISSRNFLNQDNRIRYFNWYFEDTFTAFRNLIHNDEKINPSLLKRIDLEEIVCENLNRFIKVNDLDSLFTIHDIYRSILKISFEESFLIDFCTKKLEEFNKTFYVSSSVPDHRCVSFVDHPYDKLKSFLEKISDGDEEMSSFEQFLHFSNSELYEKIKLSKEWMSDENRELRHEELLLNLLSFEKISKIPFELKKFDIRMQSQCGKDFSGERKGEALKRISKRLADLLILQEEGFLDDIKNMFEIKEITGKYIRPIDIFNLENKDKQIISIFI